MFKKIIIWFEKNNKISWVITILTAVIIFYISSLTFELGGPGPSFPYLSYAYHFTAFFFLEFFLLISMIKGKKVSDKIILSIAVIAVLYGISDEIHQYFVPGRACSINDVIINSLGILLAAGFYKFRLKRPQ